MKIKITSTIVCSLFYLLSHAQLQQGNILAGANLANINFNLNKGGNFSASLTPKLAWFIKNDIAVGLYASFGLTTAKDAGTSINYGLGALGRYYFSKDEVNLVRHARLFMEANTGIEGYNPAIGDNTNGLGLGFGPGVTYFITPSIGLELLAKYEAIIGFGSVVATNNLSINFGFQIYLPSRRVKDAMDNKPERRR